MRSRLRISASITALIAAACVCATGSVAGMLLAASPAQAAETAAENGVRAVPSGQVDGAALGKVGALTPAQIEPPAPLVVPAPPAPEPIPVSAPTPAPAATPVIQQLADAAPESGPEEDAVYRRPPRHVADTAASVDQDAPPQLTKVSDGQAPPSSIGQHVAFPRRSAEAASAFDGYMHAVAAINAGFRSGQGVASALRQASAYDAHQLEEGMIAYGAMAAMQSPRFVYAVMDVAANPRDRQALIEALQADPEAAARLPGAGEAAAMASGAILREARPVVDNGHALKQAAYDVQHQDWSIVKATNQPERLAQAKAASAIRVAAHEGDVAHLLGQITALGGEGGRGGSAVSPVIDHSLALAALSILDGTEGGDGDRLESVVSERVSAECLKMAKLNLFQCLSVAGPEYEDVFCLGQHGVLDTGQCVASSAAPAEAMLLSQGPRMSRRPE